MKCVICKNGEREAGQTTVRLERSGSTFVIQGVPAAVCENCGAAYFDEETTARLLKVAEEQARAGVKVDIREFVTA